MKQTGDVHSAWVRDLVQQGLRAVQVQVSADFYVDFPVEILAARGPVYIDPADLDLTPALVADLVRWQQWFTEHTDIGSEDIEIGGPEAWADWREGGAQLAQRLQAELGPAFEVRAVGLDA